MNLADALVTFLAGLLTSFSPCLFPVLPSYVMYLARRLENSMTVTTAFALSLGAGLTIYAFAASAFGQLLISFLNLSPSAIAVALSTIFFILAVMQVTPARELRLLTPKGFKTFKRLDLIGAIILGFSFSFLAAPCASGPLLALAARAALNPDEALAYSLLFSLGAALPFIVTGFLARSLGPSIYRVLSHSVIVRRSGELTAVLFTSYAVANLWISGDPFHFIKLELLYLSILHSMIWGGFLLASGLFLFVFGSYTSRCGLVRLLTVPLITSGLIRAINLVLSIYPNLTTLIMLNSLYDFISQLTFAKIIVSAFTLITWTVTYVTGGGFIIKWISLSLASLVASDIANLLYSYHIVSEVIVYATEVLSLGIAPTLLAIIPYVYSLKHFSERQ